MLQKNWLACGAASLLLLGAETANAQACDPPRILFVLDASSSMLATIPATGMSKWQAVQDAVAAVFASYADSAQYGLMTFPGPAGGCTTGTVRVDVAVGTAGAITSTLGSLTIPSNNQTPAGQSLVAASQYPSITNAAHPNYVIFMTDGYQFCDLPQSSGAPLCASASDCSLMNASPCPTCNSCQINTSDPNCQGFTADGCYCVREWPVRGVEALKNAGVPTYVVGFGTLTDARTLNRAATAAGTALANCNPDSTSPSCYLQATSPSELTTALSSIVQAVVTETCVGECGISGTRTCTAAGWSPCGAPSTQSCQTACGPGSQTCVNGVLGPCDSACPDGGAGAGGLGGSGGVATGGAAGTPAGGSGANTQDAGSSGGNTQDSGGAGSGSLAPEDSGDDGSCGCKVAGTEGRSSGTSWLLGLIAAGMLRRRRRGVKVAS